MSPVTCEWFVMCTREAAGTVTHPVLGDVPTCQKCADKLDLHLVPWPIDDPATRKPWPRIERDVVVGAGIRRRFVRRNWQMGYNGHSIYQLGHDLYAVTRGADGVLVVTALVRDATPQDVSDMLALLSEWEG